jgi:hypothetical protein
LDAGVEALAKEHQQCLKAEPFAVLPVWKRSSQDLQPQLSTSPSLDGGIGAPDSPVMRDFKKPAISEYRAAFAANGLAAPTPEKRAIAAKPESVSGRLDLLTVCSEATELVQHPLIAAEEASRCLLSACCHHSRVIVFSASSYSALLLALESIDVQLCSS